MVSRGQEDGPTTQSLLGNSARGQVIEEEGSAEEESGKNSMVSMSAMEMDEEEMCEVDWEEEEDGGYDVSDDEVCDNFIFSTNGFWCLFFLFIFFPLLFTSTYCCSFSPFLVWISSD